MRSKIDQTITARKIYLDGAYRIGLFFTYNPVTVKELKRVPHIQYNRALKCWHLPDTTASVDALRKVPLSLLWQTPEPEPLEVSKNKPKQPISREWSEKIRHYAQYLEQRRYSASTIKSYLQILKIFFAWWGLRPEEELTIAALRTFNHAFFIKEKHSRSYQNIWINALKLFLDKYHSIDIDPDELERPRKSEYLPVILSEQEVQKLIQSYRNLKHKAIIMTFYACGLRKSELLHLKIMDIDSERGVIRIRNSKGAKDRDIALPAALLQLLRAYYKKYRPKDYLFNGQNRLQYSATSIDKLLKTGLKRCGIKKKITPHSLRHSFATHLVERNINLRFIQDALGHRSSKTTEIYTRLSKENIANMVSPVDFWDDIITKSDK